MFNLELLLWFLMPFAIGFVMGCAVIYVIDRMSGDE